MTRRPATKPAPAQDHGATGPAMASRPSRMAETITAGVSCRVMGDEHLIDKLKHYGQLSDPQHAAAARLLEMAAAAGLLPGGSAAFGRIGKSPEMSDAMAEARAAWNRLLSRVGALRAELLTALILQERHPGVPRLATTQAILDDLARKWGLN